MLLPPGRERAELLEIVRISDAARPFGARGLVGDAVEVWAGDEVVQALALVGELPDGEKARCFVPGWGLRAYSGDDPDPLFEIAFCFRCNGARVRGPDVPAEQRSQDFDGESPAARELLRRFRECGAGGE
ncbi:hypothetical protein OG562_15220 [Streptomyces sp. NBC_01275]|uniref:hypothetical protein n=1 Tax=Streptomyces sp. NBC_01275 TaxID=2903807 RepID=UPI002256D65A|nr:hypothetical protein [Streptomyces sp. NBC_01275]MCX4762302.1 hypothetical protein [Streptomyces sp. NBC_01275]